MNTSTEKATRAQAVALSILMGAIVGVVIFGIGLPAGVLSWWNDTIVESAYDPNNPLRQTRWWGGLAVLAYFGIAIAMLAVPFLAAAGIYKSIRQSQ